MSMDDFVIPDNLPAGPVTINGVTVPDNVCAHAYFGKTCPFDKANGGRGCKYRHDMKYDPKKPAAPALNLCAAYANQSTESTSAAPATAQRSANSPARGVDGKNDMDEF